MTALGECLVALEASAADEHPRVRLEAVVAVSGSFAKRAGHGGRCPSRRRSDRPLHQLRLYPNRSCLGFPMEGRPRRWKLGLRQTVPLGQGSQRGHEVDGIAGDLTAGVVIVESTTGRQGASCRAEPPWSPSSPA